MARIDAQESKVKPAQVSYEVKVEIPDDDDNGLFSWKKLWKFTGPGFLMSIAYLDPGNIEGDLQAGAVAHYKLIWVLLLAHILGLLLQRLAARIGVVTGRHMAEIAHGYYPRVPRLILWIMVEIAIIGSDMQEVIGTAISLYLLSNTKIPLWAGVLITITDTFTFLFLERYGIRKFEGFFCFLISLMAIAFGFEFVKSAPPAGPLFEGMFVPWCSHCDANQLMQVVSIIGAVIMPHNFYLHSALVKSRSVDRRKVKKISEANFYYFIESAIALFCSYWINFLVIAVFAHGLYGKTNADVLNTCQTTHNGMPSYYKDVFTNDTETATADIYHAGIFLGCTFGVAALYIWAIGIMAAGQSSTMTGTYAGQFAMEGFVQIKISTWKRVLITRSLAIAPTLVVTIFSGGIDNISSLNNTLNCVQMVQLPFAVLPALTFVSDRRLMHEFRCDSYQKIGAIISSFAILIINFFFFFQTINDSFGFTALSIPLTALFGLIYLAAIFYLFYYCLVAMEYISPWNVTWLPEPKYEQFDAPWVDEAHKPTISSLENSEATDEPQSY